MITDEQRARIVDAARSYLGVRFVHMGRTAHGLDCVGLLLRAAWDAGLHPVDAQTYSPVVNGDRVKAEIERRCTEIDREPRPGDILLFNVGGSPQHTAMVTTVGGDPHGREVHMIHAHQSLGRVVEHRLDQSWVQRIVGAYEWRGG